MIFLADKFFVCFGAFLTKSIFYKILMPVVMKLYKSFSFFFFQLFSSHPNSFAPIFCENVAKLDIRIISEKITLEKQHFFVEKDLKFLKF